MEEFGESSRTIGTLMISIYVLGYAFGPLVLAPLSEMYGRPLVINCSSIVFNAFLLGCALAPNMPSLIIMRLFAGIGGSAIMTIVSACIGDVFRVHERASASAIVIGTPSLSPVGMSCRRNIIVDRLTISPSRTNYRRLHYTKLGMAMGLLDHDHGYWPTEHPDVFLHAGIQSPDYPRKENRSPEERAREG